MYERNRVQRKIFRLRNVFSDLRRRHGILVDRNSSEFDSRQRVSIAMLKKGLLSVILLTFGIQSVEAAFRQYAFVSLICTCNHASKAETHEADIEDEYFVSKTDSSSQILSIGRSGKLPDCHSVKNKQSEHECACKKHEKNYENPGFSFQFLNERSEINFVPSKIDSATVIASEVPLPSGYQGNPFRPPHR
ncbi:hypothetical protein BES34_019725 [Leptospira inadai serovar Lyme]|nr:hypothetical protein BES34_019725 [Leptospira inadai serovar Lyme]